MKRLVFTVTTDLTYDQRMQRICRSLAEAGYEVLLVGRELPASQPLGPAPYRQIRLRCRYHKGKLFYLEYMARLWHFLRQQPADAFCAIDLDTALPVCLVAQAQHKPFIYDAHEYFTEVVELTQRPRVKAFWKRIERYIVPRTQLAYTVTQSLARLFAAEYHQPFEVIRNVSVLRPLEAKPAAGRPYLIYQGAVNEGRGLAELLEAMQQLDLPLYICGQGDVLPELQAQTAALGLTEKVIFTGYLLPEELRELTQGAWLGYNLLENRGLSYYYSLANKFFDYVHAGVPQLCADFPEYRQLNAEFEVARLTELSAAAIVREVKGLQANPALYAQLAQRCLKARQVWNWQQEEQQLRALYRQLIPLP